MLSDAARVSIVPTDFIRELQRVGTEEPLKFDETVALPDGLGNDVSSIGGFVDLHF